MYRAAVSRAYAAKRPEKANRFLASQPFAWLDSTKWRTLAFLGACRAKMLDVKGAAAQRHGGGWRHSMASALLARQTAHMLAREGSVC